MYSENKCTDYFTLASYDTVYWPYKTDGHYTNLVDIQIPIAIIQIRLEILIIL